MNHGGTVQYFDGHNDALSAILDCMGDEEMFLSKKAAADGTTLQLNLPDGIKGGFCGGFFAAFAPSNWGAARANKVVFPGGYRWPPAPRVSLESAVSAVDSQVKILDRIMRMSDGRVRLLTSRQEIHKVGQSSGVIFPLLHFEGAEAIAPDFSNLEYWFERGLRSLSLTWSRPNEFADGADFIFPAPQDTGAPLTAKGKELVRHCNALGIVIDVSHLNVNGFWSLVDYTKRPIIASHSNVYELCRSNRNLRDDQIRAIAASGGVVGINFGCHDVRADGQEDPEVDISLIADHICYVVALVGEDHVGIGSDFDGTTTPRNLKDVSSVPLLVAELLARRLSEKSITKILYQNWLRVLMETLP